MASRRLLASVLFVLASITDGLDGYLARKRGQITTMGMLLDPIADKIMVTGALIALVAYNPAGGQGLDRRGHHRARVPDLRPALHRFVRGVHHPGQRPGQAQDRYPDRLRGLRHPGAPLGPVAVRRADRSPSSGLPLRRSTSRCWFRRSRPSTTLWASGSRSTTPRRTGARRLCWDGGRARAFPELRSVLLAQQKAPTMAGAF